MQNNNYLFIQTGGIGDLIIFSKLMEKIRKEDDHKVYFLINESSISLFSDKNYFSNIIPLEINKFRYNLIYRIQFISFLRKLKINEVYNLTSARTAWNDSLALCIGAKATYCNYNNWKTVYPELKNIIHKKYDYVLNKDTFNEYERIENLIEYLKKKYSFVKEKVEFNNPKNKIFDYDIIISPFSSDIQKDWPINNFVEIIKNFHNRFKILIMISPKQLEKAKFYFKNCNVEYSANLYNLSNIERIIMNSRLYIGLDSGPSHIAQKVNIKSIVLVAGGTFNMYFPNPYNFNTLYLFNQLDCFGCEWQCILKEKECITKVSVEKVYSAICQILECD